MDHHRHVDVVEMAFGDQFGLAEEELDLALLAAAEALLDIDELLGRHREEHQFPGEVLGCARRREAHRDAEHAGDLGVVAAAVRGAGMRVGERVVGGAQAVEFADEGEARPGRVAADAALDPGQREAGSGAEAEGGHAGDERRGLGLVEPGLGVMEDGFAEFDDLVAVALDRLAHRPFQFVLLVIDRHVP